MLPLDKQNAYRKQYARLNPDWRTSGEEFEALIRKHIRPTVRVLDLGCGRGGVMELFWREVDLSVGLDPDLVSLIEHRTSTLPQRGASRSGTEQGGVKSKGTTTGMPFVCGFGDALPFPAESFDLVLALWVLEHLAQPDKVLSEIRRVLRSPDPASGIPGGRFLFLTPNAHHPLVLFNRFSWAFPAVQRVLIPRLYGRAEADTFRVRYQANTLTRLRALAEAHGFQVTSLRTIHDPTYLAFSHWLFVMSMALERMLPEGSGVHVVGEWRKV